MEFVDEVIHVARMMEVAVKTAPKTKGEDFVACKIVSGGQIKDLAEAMVKFGKETSKKNFDRDGASVAESQALILIGLKRPATVGLNCGACGFSTCKELEAARATDVEFAGPACSYRHLDMGIAIGSAARTAQMFNVDNRIMYRAGVAARRMGLVDWEFVVGMPLSVSGKNIYFDRK